MANKFKSKVLKALKAAGEYFATASGGAVFICTVIGAFVAIPPFVSLPIALVVGLAFAYYGGKDAWKRLLEAEQAEALTAEERRHAEQAIEMVRHINQDVKEIKHELDRPKSPDSAEKNIVITIKDEKDHTIVMKPLDNAHSQLFFKRVSNNNLQWIESKEAVNEIEFPQLVRSQTI